MRQAENRFLDVGKRELIRKPALSIMTNLRGLGLAMLGSVALVFL